MSAIPELEPHCGSWIVTSPSGRITELYERSNAEKALAAGYKVQTALVYLCEFNKSISSDDA